MSENEVKNTQKSFENENAESNIEELVDEELEEVSGGTTYSSGVVCTAPGENYGIKRQYVIVTALNTCPSGNGDICGACSASFGKGLTLYCCNRWKGHDTIQHIPGQPVFIYD